MIKKIIYTILKKFKKSIDFQREICYNVNQGGDKMIDKENQMISISLKEYEELLELKWLFSHSTNKPDEIASSILNIISKRIKIDTYDNSIVERSYNDAEKILKEITELFKYVNPELYERLVIIAKDNLKRDNSKKDKKED